MLTGENSLIWQATKAKEETESASIAEQRKLAQIEASMNLENTEYKGITIPAGFAPTRIDGEDTVENGLVITDSEGNEFVWVPVENFSEFCAIYSYSSSNGYSEPYANGYAKEISEYNSMKASVETNHGFYIGRYETGKVDNQVVVKKNVPVYNLISWSASNDMTCETGGAVTLAKNFAINKGYTSVTSSLCYGVQWDATLQFFDSNYITGTCDSNSYVRNSTGKGNYSGILMNTGSNDNYAVKNIYDMAGNVQELTMEAWNWQTEKRRVVRGGSFHNDGYSSPVFRRDTLYQLTLGIDTGFRITLYL